jgi:hypothetical protein
MSICLSMIVKNEAHCITKCLESVKPFINYWVICDNGSSDNTESVVKSYLHDIPGEYHHHIWSDFATNRNKALSLAKDKSDYILIMDADDYLVVNDNDIFNNLKHDAYYIKIHHGSIDYSRIQLINNCVSCKYIGVLHEYLQLSKNIQPTMLNNCYIYYGATGFRSKDPEKYLKDALIFEKALLDEPLNSRYVFYCAQSYRDANMYEKALQFYKKRSVMGGWVQEIYLSLLESAKLTERIDPCNHVKIEECYLAAFNYLPERAEALYYLASYCRRNNFFNKAYFFAKIGSVIKVPENALFLEKDIYIWKILDELAIASYYIGNKKMAADLNNQILQYNNLSKNNKERIIKNLQFCI